MPEEKRKQLLVMTVGTTEEPLKAAIENAHKEGIDSVALLYGRGLVQKKAPLDVATSLKSGAQALELKVVASEVPDPEDLASVVKEMSRSVIPLLEGVDRVVFDITGGTKPMSAALAHVAHGIEGGPEVVIQYTGGGKRDQHGRVIGQMRTTRVEAWRQQYHRVLANLRSRRYYQAYHLVQVLPQYGKASYLKSLVMGLRDWDNFDYQNSHAALSRIKRMGGLLEGDDEIAPLTRLAERLLGAGEEIVRVVRILCDNTRAENLKGISAEPSLREGLFYHIADTLNNADRRLAEGRTPDAALRAYRAVEVSGQLALLALEVNPWNVNWGHVPSTVVEDMFGDLELDSLPSHVSLNQGLKLLWGLSGSGEDAIDWDALRTLQQIRNYSCLEHGYQKVTQDSASKAVNIAESLVRQILSFVHLDGIIADRRALLAFETT